MIDPTDDFHAAGNFAGFDHFCDVLDVKTDELPHAFAAWLGGSASWNGTYEPVKP